MNYEESKDYLSAVQSRLSVGHQWISNASMSILNNPQASPDDQWIAAIGFVKIYNENTSLDSNYYDAAETICNTVDPSKPNGFTRPR